MTIAKDRIQLAVQIKVLNHHGRSLEVRDARSGLHCQVKRALKGAIPVAKESDSVYVSGDVSYRQDDILLPVAVYISGAGPVGRKVIGIVWRVRYGHFQRVAEGAVTVIQEYFDIRIAAYLRLPDWLGLHDQVRFAIAIQIYKRRSKKINGYEGPARGGCNRECSGRGEGSSPLIEKGRDRKLN